MSATIIRDNRVGKTKLLARLLSEPTTHNCFKIIEQDFAKEMSTKMEMRKRNETSNEAYLKNIGPTYIIKEVETQGQRIRFQIYEVKNK